MNVILFDGQKEDKEKDIRQGMEFKAKDAVVAAIGSFVPPPAQESDKGK